MKYEKCFLITDFFGDITCKCGGKIRTFNLEKNHYVACDKCKIFSCFGANLISSWKDENDDIWAKNLESIRDYEDVPIISRKGVQTELK